MKQTKPHPSKAASDENAALHLAMMQMVDAQLQHNSPPETKKTYERLMKGGFTDAQAREMLATAMAKEISQILNITVSRVSQIHSKIINSLKLKLAEYNA